MTTLVYSNRSSGIPLPVPIVNHTALPKSRVPNFKTLRRHITISSQLWPTTFKIEHSMLVLMSLNWCLFGGNIVYHSAINPIYTLLGMDKKHTCNSSTNNAFKLAFATFNFVPKILSKNSLLLTKKWFTVYFQLV